MFKNENLTSDYSLNVGGAERMVITLVIIMCKVINRIMHYQ
jgi:hypothetical protein